MATKCRPVNKAILEKRYQGVDTPEVENIIHANRKLSAPKYRPFNKAIVEKRCR